VTRAKAAGLSAAFLVSGLALSVGLTNLAVLAFWPGGLSSLAQASGIQTAATLAAFGITTWVFGIRLGGLDSSALRWRADAGGARRGFVLGTVPALVAMAAAIPLAGAAWVPDGGTMGSWAGTLPGLALVLLPAAFAEEFAFRGAGLVLLARAFGRPLRW
jgi:hypothetical protein